MKVLVSNTTSTARKVYTCTSIHFLSNIGPCCFFLTRSFFFVIYSYQLSVVPDTYPNRDDMVTDLPKDADTKRFFLKDGDLILLATDGYFDNMYSHETLELINSGMEPIEESQTDNEVVTATIRGLAKTLTDRARRLSLNPKRLSPWAKAAQAHGSNYRGGKVDDITCIVTLVSQNK